MVVCIGILTSLETSLLGSTRFFLSRYPNHSKLAVKYFAKKSVPCELMKKLEERDGSVEIPTDTAPKKNLNHQG